MDGRNGLGLLTPGPRSQERRQRAKVGCPALDALEALAEGAEAMPDRLEGQFRRVCRGEQRGPRSAAHFRYSASFSRWRRVVRWAYMVVVVMAAWPSAS